jgi:peptidoglycan/LPS O-acetylase OafA/YrhL
MDKRSHGYDLVRSLAIITVFLAHAARGSTVPLVSISLGALSPGLTMSLLGFISAALLSGREEETGAFLLKRIARIYPPLILCLSLILALYMLIGKIPLFLDHAGHVMAQHTLLHLMGFSAFFGFLEVESTAPIGAGLWFITAIMGLYLLLPLLRTLFQQPKRFRYLLGIVAICTGLDAVMYGGASFFNVVVSFTVGVYCGVTGALRRLTDANSVRWPLACCVGLLAIAMLGPQVRGLLYAFYPLAFVPVLFALSRVLPRPLLAGSAIFAGISYEFYILHFYFLFGYADFFPRSVPASGQVLVAFVSTSTAAWIIRYGASWIRTTVESLIAHRGNALCTSE